MLIFLILVLADICIWWLLIGDTRRLGPVMRVLVLTVKVIISLTLIYLITRILLYKGEFADPANTFRYIVLGAMGAFIITAGSLYIVASLLIHLLERKLKRRFNGLVLANLIISAALLLLFADGYFRQRLNITTTRQEITLGHLDSRLDGMKIVLISDLHLSSWYGHYDRLSDMVSTVNAEKPDLLINAGDFITYGWQEYDSCDTILHRAHAVSGAYAVYGNHDDGTYYPDYDKRYGKECIEMIKQKIIASGYILLSDTAVIIRHNGTEIAVAGIVTHGHHLNMRYGDFNRTLVNLPDSVFSLLIVHDPGAWEPALSGDKRPRLTLAGHTHGMQIGLPVPGGYISPASLIHKRWRGLYRKNDNYLYVSTGLGCIGMAIRIFMPPQIVVITLKKQHNKP
jgi:predicted MPP superfamily phosphohydrolase